MARVVLAHSYGGPEVLALEEREVAAPGPGEVTLEVRSAGINPVDWKLFGGHMGADPDKLPRRVGFEAAGVITAVGDGAEGPRGPIAVGDEVIAFRVMGAYAEALTIPAASCVPKPAEIGFEAAGGLMLTGATAVHLLEATRVGDEDTVLIHGAAGGVGRMAVQLARARGAHVIATASERNHDVLRALGAEPVTYGDGLEGRVRGVAPNGVDAALDCVGTDEAVEVSLAVVADRDRIATIAAFERGAEAGIKRLGGGPGADPGTELRDRARLELIDAVSVGTLQVEVRAFPLDQVADAIRAGQAGHADGKLVLVP